MQKQIKKQIGTFKTQLSMHKRNGVSTEDVHLAVERSGRKVCACYCLKYIVLNNFKVEKRVWEESTWLSTHQFSLGP